MTRNVCPTCDDAEAEPGVCRVSPRSTSSRHGHWRGRTIGTPPRIVPIAASRVINNNHNHNNNNNNTLAQRVGGSAERRNKMLATKTSTTGSSKTTSPHHGLDASTESKNDVNDDEEEQAVQVVQVQSLDVCLQQRLQAAQERGDVVDLSQDAPDNKDRAIPAAPLTHKITYDDAGNEIVCIDSDENDNDKDDEITEKSSNSSSSNSGSTDDHIVQVVQVPKRARLACLACDRPVDGRQDQVCAACCPRGGDVVGLQPASSQSTNESLEQEARMWATLSSLGGEGSL